LRQGFLRLLLLLRQRLAWVRNPKNLAQAQIGFKQPADQQNELGSGFFVFGESSVVTTAQLKSARETEAQRIERLKREKNPWEALEEIRAFARQGRVSVLPEWAGTYFKWWGIYTQGDGAGAVGGEGGEGRSTEYFMMRVALPSGRVRSHQLQAIAEISERYARSSADLTVRQNIQLHWLTIEAIPEVMEALGGGQTESQRRLWRRCPEYHGMPVGRSSRR
jgi:Nitrite/Sulfite reductase ferredoxin-like half domain